MLENKWNNIAPEVPQDFHDKFEETLRHIEQADAVDKKYKRKRFSGRLLIAAAVICTGMGVNAVIYISLKLIVCTVTILHQIFIGIYPLKSMI